MTAFFLSLILLWLNVDTEKYSLKDFDKCFYSLSHVLNLVTRMQKRKNVRKKSILNMRTFQISKLDRILVRKLMFI